MSDLLDSGEEDRISGLPWEILNIILRKLTIGDAIRTSVLSRNWRYKWLSLSDFHLDADKFAEILKHRYRYNYVGGNLFEVVDDVDIVAKETGWDVVNSVVNTYILHHTSSIRSFSLKATCDNHCRDMGQWMHYLSKQPIEALSIESSILSHSKMPSHIFSCKKLKSLRLKAFALEIPPSFGSFKLLNELYLNSVTISEADLSHLILSCPLLEYLTLLYIPLLWHLRIHAPKLIELSVNGEFEDIVIEAAPNLSRVRHSGSIGESLNLQSVIRCLSGIGSLRILDLSDGFMRALVTADGLLLRNDAVTSLNLDSMFSRYGIDSFKGCLSVLNSCHNIKHFTFLVRHSPSCRYFLSSCRNINHLIFLGESGEYLNLLTQFVTENEGQHSFTKLESITLVCKCYSRMSAAVIFFVFIALHSPNLKFFTIQTEWEVYQLEDLHVFHMFDLALVSQLRRKFPHVLVSYQHFEQPNSVE